MTTVGMGFQSILFWILGFASGWFLLYYVIRIAVKHGIRDSGLLDKKGES
jgi:hypothetical protein